MGNTKPSDLLSCFSKGEMMVMGEVRLRSDCKMLFSIKARCSNVEKMRKHFMPVYVDA